MFDLKREDRKIQEILQKRKDGWEHTLLIISLKEDILFLENKYRNLEKKIFKENKINNLDNFIELSYSIIDKLSSLMHDLNIKLNNNLEKAIGKVGEEGNAENIIEYSNIISRSYEEILLQSMKLKEYSFPDSFEDVYFSICEILDAFKYDLDDFIYAFEEDLKKILIALERNKDLRGLTIHLLLDFSNFSRKLEDGNEVLKQIEFELLDSVSET